VEVERGAPEFKEVSDLFHAVCSRGEWRVARVDRVSNLLLLLPKNYQKNKNRATILMISDLHPRL